MMMNDMSVLQAAVTPTVAPDDSLTCVLRILNRILKQVPAARSRRRMIAAGLLRVLVLDL